jgi:hypothetical protein
MDGETILAQYDFAARSLGGKVFAPKKHRGFNAPGALPPGIGAGEMSGQSSEWHRLCIQRQWQAARRELALGRRAQHAQALCPDGIVHGNATLPKLHANVRRCECRALSSSQRV